MFVLKNVLAFLFSFLILAAPVKRKLLFDHLYEYFSPSLSSLYFSLYEKIDLASTKVIKFSEGLWFSSKKLPEQYQKDKYDLVARKQAALQRGAAELKRAARVNKKALYDFYSDDKSEEEYSIEEQKLLEKIMK